MTWTRRLFLRETYLGWLSLVVGPAGYGLVRSVLRHHGSSGLAELNLGRERDFIPGDSRILEYGDQRVIVVRSAQGIFYAVSAVCTHLGCSIRFEPKGDIGEFACNCHNSRFALDGENVSGPATIPLQQFRVRIDQGNVVLSPGKEDDED